MVIAVWLVLLFGSGLASAANQKITEITCQSAAGARVELLVDQDLSLGLAWLNERGQIESRSGYLVPDDLLKVYVFNFDDGRFIIEDDFVKEKISRSYAKLQTAALTLNLICQENPSRL